MNDSLTVEKSLTKKPKLRKAMDMKPSKKQKNIIKKFIKSDLAKVKTLTRGFMFLELAKNSKNFNAMKSVLMTINNL